jgi:DNA-binding beta-propeller fold protein YncE
VIPAGSHTNYLAYDSGNGEIFVTTGTDKTVLVISDAHLTFKDFEVLQNIEYW